MASFNLHYLFKGPVSKYSPSEGQGFKANGGGNAAQSLTDNKVLLSS